MNKTYTVSVTRDGKWWMIAVPELDALTQARRIDDVPTAAKELIALETGVALADVEIEQHIELEPGERISRSASPRSQHSEHVWPRTKPASKPAPRPSRRSSPPLRYPSATSDRFSE